MPRKILPHPLDPTLAMVPLTRGLFAIISVEDVVEVGKWNWSAESREHTVYARTNIPGQRGKPGSNMYLHRFVGTRMGLSEDLFVDHESRNGLDCRRTNIRSANDAENGWNSGMRSNNKSGIKGVHWSSRIQKWIASVRIGGGKSKSGTFDNPQDAGEFAAKIRGEYHGAFARSN